MDKSVFYKQALMAGSYARKDWVISAFSVVRSNPQMQSADESGFHNEKLVGMGDAYEIRYNRESTEVLVRDEHNEFTWVTIDNHPPMTPLFSTMEPLMVMAGDIPNCKKDVESTYGDLLFNWIALVHPFEDRISYQVGPVNIRKIEAMISERLVDNEEVAGVKPQPDQIPVWMYMKFGRCMGALAGYTQLFVPTLTKKSLSTNHAIMKRRQELLEEHKDRLHDPVVVAKIQDELIQMDKDALKGDPSEGFLISGKTWGTARKRMFSIHGPEAGFNEGGNAELVVNSLNEGWDTTKLPAMFNSTRAGSFYRGALTALGGEAVKFFMRVFQNTSISEVDCGSKLGKMRYIEPSMLDYYEGMWEIKPDGIAMLTKERLKELSGKFVLTRSPQYCRTKLTDYCERCCGARLSSDPHVISAENTSVASMFMDIMLASAHAKELKTAELDFRAVFR